MDTLIFRNGYSKHDFAYRDYRQAFEKANVEIRFPIAREVLFDLADRMDRIYQGILDSAYRDNLYCTYIQYRSLIDHYIKIQYIAEKTGSEESDATAEQYQKHYLISEMLAEQMGVLQMEDLLNAVERQTDFLDFLHSKFPEFKEFDKQNQQEISLAMKQFNLATMVKHLTNRYRQLPGIGNGGRIFAFVCPEFSQVSSFTHGGAYAGQLLRSLSTSGKVEEQLQNKLHMGLTMLGVCKENSLIVYKLDRSFMNVINELQKARTLEATNSEDADGA